MTLASLLLSYKRQSPWRKSVIFGAVFVSPVLASALISYYLKLSLDNTLRVQLLLIIGLFFGFVVLRRFFELKYEALDKATEKQRDALAQAYASLDALISKRMSALHRCAGRLSEFGRGQDLFEAALASISHIQDPVTALYQILQSQFGRAGSLLNEIDFEVTFMTRSYIDQKITIYAYENRDHRSPRSLLLRKDDADIYAGTVTAEVYRQPRPDMVITEDTGREPYAEVYTGQRERIKSAIVYPVLSDENVLLGTLVVHCNEPSFFKRSELRFWRKLLEIYAKRIAYEKLCLDLFGKLDPARWAGEINASGVLPDR